jgi:hypothetical protein
MPLLWVSSSQQNVYPKEIVCGVKKLVSFLARLPKVGSYTGVFGNGCGF